MEQEKKTRNFKKSKEKKSKLIYIIILLLLLIIIILFLIINMLGKIEHKEAMPTGNVDIFDVIFGNVIICQHCGLHGETAASHSICAACGNKLLSEDGLLVFDKETAITKETMLNIFTHPSYYIVDNYIAPGSENAYQFVVRNNNEFAIQYGFEMVEHNNNNLNMKYKLKANGHYIIGSENEYVNADRLKIADYKLQPYSYDVFTLEWKWIDAENDTEVGIDPKTSYSLTLNLNATDIQ